MLNLLRVTRSHHLRAWEWKWFHKTASQIEMWIIDLNAIALVSYLLNSRLFSCIHFFMLVWRFQLSHSFPFALNEVHGEKCWHGTGHISKFHQPSAEEKNIQKQILTFSRSPFLRSTTFITNPPFSNLIHCMLAKLFLLSRIHNLRRTFYKFIQKSFVLIIGWMGSIHNLEIKVSFHLRTPFCVNATNKKYKSKKR